jgi:hypothetical protein
MFSLSHNTCAAIVASGFIALNSYASPVQAEELVEYLGPVGPHQPILTTVGSKRVLAFYIPGENTCALHAIVWTTEENTTSPARVRITLEPGAMVHIDSPENKSLNLKCGDDAKSLAVVEDEEQVAFGITTQEPMQAVKASASRF